MKLVIDREKFFDYAMKVVDKGGGIGTNELRSFIIQETIDGTMMSASVVWDSRQIDEFAKSLMKNLLSRCEFDGFTLTDGCIEIHLKEQGEGGESK